MFLFCFPLQSLAASKTGLLLWFDQLLPSLLPFLILSQLILKTSAIRFFQKICSPFFKKCFHCSEEGAFCILCGFLCGYPVGARLISLQLKEQRLSLDEGQRLLAFSNNVSPMFCISYGIFKGIGTTNVLPYLLIIYGSAILFGILCRTKDPFSEKIPNKKQTSQAEGIFQLMDVCIIDSFLIMIKLCGYIMLFSILSTGLLSCLPDKFPYLRACFTAFLEITNGLSCISELPKGISRTAMSIASLSFGGLCCILQTNSVISETKLSLRKYMLHKFYITLLSLGFFFLWLFFRQIAKGWS